MYRALKVQHDQIKPINHRFRDSKGSLPLFIASCLTQWENRSTYRRGWTRVIAIRHRTDAELLRTNDQIIRITEEVRNKKVERQRHKSIGSTWIQFHYVLFGFSQTAVKTFNPYKSHVSRPSQQGSKTELLSASSLLTSLKWCLGHNRPQFKHSLQASSKKAKRGVGEAITTSKSTLFTKAAEWEIEGDPCLSGLWPFPVRSWGWGSA